MVDFNYPEIHWSSSVASGSYSSPAAGFFDACVDVFLVQHVQNPTRSRGDQHSSLFDLVLTTIPDAIDTITHLAPLGCSDHDLLLWNYLCLYQPAPCSSETYLRNYSRGKYEEFNNYFCQLDWSQLFDDNNVEHNRYVLKEY